MNRMLRSDKKIVKMMRRGGYTSLRTAKVTNENILFSKWYDLQGDKVTIETYVGYNLFEEVTYKV